MGADIADVLECAADLIEPEGKWTQGRWGARETCMCAEGAIYEAVGAWPMLGHELADRAVDFVCTQIPASEGNALAEWNDAPGRTQSEVVAALRTFAALSRARGESE